MVQNVALHIYLFHFSLLTNSAVSPFSYYNSKLIEFYIRYDHRFYELAMLIKLWAKHHGFTGGSLNLGSFPLMMMVVYFLQCGTFPQILPSVVSLQELTETNRDRFPSIHACEHRFDFCDDPEVVRCANNAEQRDGKRVDELLIDFFRLVVLFRCS